jgi:pyridoxamine 5'-phosphate oxidase
VVAAGCGLGEAGADPASWKCSPRWCQAWASCPGGKGWRAAAAVDALDHIIRPVPEFAKPLREEDADPSPFDQFTRWFGEAAARGLRVPEAATLATATESGIPSARIVLVKVRDESGFVFFSNYKSRKGRELAANPRAALVFHWDALGRQVRVEGGVEQTSSKESARYVRDRPRGSQLSALASPQSEVVEGRDVLERRVADLAAEYQGLELPEPENWGGFRLLPEAFEFWQHREDRLHDRLRYTRQQGGRWLVERLAP